MEGKEKYFDADYVLIQINHYLRNNKIVYFFIKVFIGMLLWGFPIYHFINNLNFPQGNYTRSIIYIFISIIVLFFYVSYCFIFKFNSIFESQMYYHWDLQILGNLINELILLFTILKIAISINLMLYDFPNDLQFETFIESFKDYLISISDNIIYITIYFTIIHIVFKNKRFFGKFIYLISIICLFYDFKYSLKINKILLIINCIAYSIFILDYGYYKLKYKKKTVEFFLYRGFELFSIFAYYIIILNCCLQSIHIKYGIFLFLISISENLGKKYINFILLPIEKKYFLYKNDVLGRFTKKIVVKKITY